MNFHSEEINRKLFSFYRTMLYLLKYIYFKGKKCEFPLGRNKQKVVQFLQNNAVSPEIYLF